MKSLFGKFQSGLLSYDEARFQLGFEIQRLLISPAQRGNDRRSVARTDDLRVESLLEEWLFKIGREVDGQVSRTKWIDLLSKPTGGRIRRELLGVLKDFYIKDIKNAIEQLEDKLRLSGVRILTDAKIDYIKIAKGAVTGLVVDGAEIELDSLTWSVAPDQFCKMVGIELATTKPLNRITVLVGMEFDQTFLTDCHFVTIFDTEFAAFRITFYSNFRTHSAGRYGATVEFLVDPDGVSNTDWALLAESEMRKMGVVGATTKVISRHERVVRNGFPIQSNDNTDSTAAQVEKIREYSNVNVIGRASGDGWFLEDLIKKAYSVASELNV